MRPPILQEFSKLRVDTNRKTWTKATNYKSPYKPFLLLSILDLIGYGRIVRQQITTSQIGTILRSHVDLHPEEHRCIFVCTLLPEQDFHFPR
jgi:hypothetical protein